MKKRSLLLAISIALLFCSGVNFGQAPSLGTAANFVLFSTSGAVTNTGISHLTGNVGTNSGSSTGFSNIDGQMHDNDAASGACASDLGTAYGLLNSATPTFSPSSSLGNGTTLVPGVYYISSAATLTSNLILDGQGNANAVFIFQIQGAFSTGTNSKVQLINGALACNVFWKVEGLVSMAAGTTMRGNIIAHNAGINIGAGDTLEGRALSIAGAITLSNLLAYTPTGCGSTYLTGPGAPALASTKNYGLFSASGPVSNTGITYVTGDVGTNLGLTTGFNPLFVTGTIHPIPDAATATAATDLNNVYLYLNALPYDIELLYPSQFGNNLVLTPHTYIMNAATTFTDSLYLDAQGNTSAVFVIKIVGAFSTSAFSKVILINGAQARNVYWLVSGAVLIDSNSIFNGTIVVNSAAIQLNTGALLNGRALTTSGAVTVTAMTVNADTSSSISITPSDTTVCVGSTVTITPSVAGGSWSSGNTSVATVASGTVTGVSAGTATITYTTSSMSVSALVTVNALPATVTASGGGIYCLSTTITASDGSSGTIYYQGTTSGGTSTATASTSQVVSSSGIYYFRALSSSGCWGTEGSVIVTINSSGYWIGTTSTDWFTNSNWCGNNVPVSTTDVFIASGAAYYPNISSGTATAHNVTIQSNSTITVNGGAIQIGGAISNSGTFTATNGRIEMNGSSAQSIPANAFASNAIKDLSINNSAGVSLDGALKVRGTYTPAAGVFATGGYLTLASNASGTANVAQGSSGGAYVSGDVTVERYIPADSNRAWRLLSANTAGPQTINAAWQEGASAMANPNPGYGTLITCDSRYSTSAGFDMLQPDMSILAYDVTDQNWTTKTVTNTNVKAFSSEPGYFLYIRGDRSVSPSSSITGSTATTLRTTGSLLMGDQSAITVPANQYVVVGNPFASTIDFSLISSADRTNVGDRMWLWDPKLTGSYGIGGYTLCDASTSTPWMPSVTGGSYNSATSTIPSGMAFLVKGGSSSGSLALREAIKATGNSNNGFKITNSGTEQFHIILSVVNTDNSEYNADGVFALFNDKFSGAVDDDDATKLSNTGENLAIIRSGSKLTLEARPVVTTDDTVFLGVSGMKPINYSFTITPSGFGNSEYAVSLIDNYLKTFVTIDINTATVYNFSINSDAASYAVNRFLIALHYNDTSASTSVNGIIVYPNPTDNTHINVQLTNLEKGTYSFALINAIGQKSFSETVIYTGGKMNWQLRTSNIPPGIYELVTNKNGSYYKSVKLIIEKI